MSVLILRRVARHSCSTSALSASLMPHCHSAPGGRCEVHCCSERLWCLCLMFLRYFNSLLCQYANPVGLSRCPMTRLSPLMWPHTRHAVRMAGLDTTACR